MNAYTKFIMNKASCTKSEAKHYTKIALKLRKGKSIFKLINFKQDKETLTKEVKIHCYKLHYCFVKPLWKVNDKELQNKFLFDETVKDLYRNIYTIEELYKLSCEITDINNENEKFQNIFGIYYKDNGQWMESLLQYNEEGKLLKSDICGMYKDTKEEFKKLVKIYENSPQIYCDFFEQEIQNCMNMIIDLDFWKCWIIKK